MSLTERVQHAYRHAYYGFYDLRMLDEKKAREAVKNRVVFGSGCLFCSPRPFGFRHLGLPFRRSRGFPIRKKNYDKMDLV